jgi:hypothetical protein
MLIAEDLRKFVSPVKIGPILMFVRGLQWLNYFPRK